MCAFANEVISRGGVLTPVVPDPLIPSSLYFHHPPPFLPTRLNAIVSTVWLTFPCLAPW